MDDDNYLVPDRECGGCMVCCIEPAIHDPALEKPAGVTCPNCVASSCAIYAARPQVCRDYFCMWRRLPFLDAEWRPDLSGVLIAEAADASGTPNNFAVELIVTAPHTVIESERFAGLVAGFLASGTGTFLNIPGGPGQPARRTRLQDWVLPAVEARDLAGVIAGIRGCYEATVTAQFPPPEPGAA
jgi:hypothetical protein